jgi:hypothetical protein
MCRAIVEASHLPMSIIVVGIGNENFGSMDLLDSDDHALKDETGKEALRDIVQFFPFRDYAQNGTRLAQAVLAELPSQVSQFMRCSPLHSTSLMLCICSCALFCLLPWYGTTASFTATCVLCPRSALGVI